MISVKGAREQSREISFFGRPCRFSAIVLAALLEHGYRVRLIVLPGPPRTGSHILQKPEMAPRIPLLPASPGASILPTVSSLGWSAGARIARISRDQLPALPRQFAELSGGVAIAACFPWRIPASILEAPPAGAINVHPALLPRHRGPDPLFWTFHAGDTVTGATVHRMTSELDAGQVLAQESIDIDLRTRYDELEEVTVRLGSQLLVGVLDRLSAGDSRDSALAGPVSHLEPFPNPHDFRLSPDWTAERAFRFVYGLAGGSTEFSIDLAPGSTIAVRDALDLLPGSSLGAPFVRHGERISVQFGDGVVQFQAKPT